MTEIVEGDLATKDDLKNVESNLKHDLKIVETNLLNASETRFGQVELKINNLENKIQQTELKLTIKLGTLLLIGFTAVASLMKFWLIR